MGLLLPDPASSHCPLAFKEAVKKILAPIRGAGEGRSDEALRSSLLEFIADFSNWDNIASPAFVEAARALVRAAYPGGPPLVVDPFAGGGSIPLEALRLGCEGFASDLNPVACFILEILLSDIPRYGRQLADELRRLGPQIKVETEKELGEFYPPDSDGAKPIVYFWARTVRCESPNCGAEIPLVRSFWLSQKPNLRRALRYKILRQKGGAPRVEFEIFNPTSDRDVPLGTVSRAKATCLCCGSVLPPERVRAQLRERRGGTDVVFDTTGSRIGGAQLLAVVTVRPGEQGRHFRLAMHQDYEAAWRAMNRIHELEARSSQSGVALVPNEPLPLMSGTFNVPIYGMDRWGDLFSARQKLALVTLARHIKDAESSNECRHLLACALSIFARSCNGNARLRPDSSVAPAFGMQSLPITWAFPETVLWGGRSEHFDGSVQTILDVVDSPCTKSAASVQVQIADATEHPLPDETAAIWFTDPPYYFAVPYADLSDFFYVWLKRALPGDPLLRDPYDAKNCLTPKDREICEMAHWDQERYPHKDRAFFEDKMAQAFAEGRRVLDEQGIGSVVFAHKTTEGWEALLSGMVRGGWTITGSWPIATEAPTRLRAREAAALATSVHLICRPRAQDAPIGDWGEIIRELPHRIQQWIDRLSAEGIRGADLVFSCIGPAMELFSRYPHVETADGEEVGLAGNPHARSEAGRNGFLWYIWQVVGRAALRRVLGGSEGRVGADPAGTLEEDARLTALFLWTLQSTANGNNGKTESAKPRAEEAEEAAAEEDDDVDAIRKPKAGLALVYDVARRFAQPLGINLEQWRGRIIEIEKGTVRLLPVAERGPQLFGREGAEAMAQRIMTAPENAQVQLFPDERRGAPPVIRTRIPREATKRPGRAGSVEVAAENPKDVRDRPKPIAAMAAREPTTLDRVHAAMLLQASGQAAALRVLLETETKRGPEFLRLANALSALYPKASEEKRLLDALLAVPRR